MRNSLFFNVNGLDRHVDNPDPLTTLASYLRESLGLTGCKIGCAEGACGSCTVVVGRVERGKIGYRAINACVTPLFAVDGAFILTIEAVGNSKNLHPIQKRLAAGHGTQCGFCSPGFVMSAFAAARNTNNNLTRRDIDQAIKGNLCRCTGYRPILESLYSFEGCCKGNGKANGVNGCPCAENGKSNAITDFDQLPNLHESQELIFPPSLQEVPPQDSLHIHGNGIELYVPENETELNALLKNYSTAQIISSGMLERMKGAPSSTHVWISVSKCFRVVETNDKEISVGSSLSITELLEAIRANCDSTVVDGFDSLFDKYSSTQIANLASWAGSISTAKSGDLYTISSALELELLLQNPSGEKVRKSAREYTSSNGLILALIVPKTVSGKIFTYKAGARHGPGSGIVVAAVNVKENGSKFFVAASRRSVQLREVEKMLDKKISAESKLLEALENDLKSENLANLETDLIKAAVIELAGELNGNLEKMTPDDFQASQIYEKNTPDAVGRPISHNFADLSVTGEALFVGDFQMKDALHLGYVLSTEAHATFEVDASEALKLPGVYGFFDVKSLPSNGNNRPGTLSTMIIPCNAPVFADGEVESCGQTIGVIAAADAITAAKAVKTVKVHYKKLPSILTIEEAIAANSRLHDKPHVNGVTVEEVEGALLKCSKTIEGTVNIGGQEHIYLEPQVTMAVPGERDEITLHCSTQGSSIVQNQVAAILGISTSEVTVRAKRLGGAFGGKASQSMLCAGPAAVVANKLKRPVLAAFTRKEDISATGKRHPVLAKYRVGYSESGKLEAAHFQLYFDGGYAWDHSPFVAMVAIMFADACFKVPVFRAEGSAMKTNKNSNTAFRAYGNPQIYALWEVVFHRIALELNQPIEKIKQLNFNLCGGTTSFGFKLHNDALEKCYDEVVRMANLQKLHDEVEKFNASHKHLKRGVAAGTTRFGLTHAGAHEQASVLVQIFLDGSVTVSIGGAEMGQGLLIKCQQVASRALGIPIDRIRMAEASTDKTANIPETGGSQGADIHGKAIQLACGKLLEVLKPILKEKETWDAAVMEAHMRRLPLQASEHMNIQRSDFGLPEGMPTYFTTGAAVVVAEIDTTSGDHKLISVDIVMDVGKSLNPAIDIGQIEGAFIQGYGMLTCEELDWDANGSVVQNSLGKYNIPTAAMVPNSFNVKLLGDSPSYEGQVYSSKGIGEPPLLLGATASSAIRAAIQAHRRQFNVSWPSEESTPLSRARILDLCRAPKA